MLTKQSCILTMLFFLLSKTSADQVQFTLMSPGSFFLPYNPSDLLASITYIINSRRCMDACLNNVRCRTIHFDQSSTQCSLFTSWIFEGNISSSGSSVSQVAFITQQATFYKAFLQPCAGSNDPLNRYMQCVNSVWTCPDQYFFNGSLCEQRRSINMTCATSDWCNPSKYLICQGLPMLCQCNSSMEWNGSQCVPICLYGPNGISFDNIANGTTILNGYGGLHWSNLQGCYVNYDYRACNQNTNLIAFTRVNETFVLKQLVVGVFASNVTVAFNGIRNGTIVRSIVFSLTNSSFWFIALNWTNIDTVNITSSPQSAIPIINIDNICYSI